MTHTYQVSGMTCEGCKAKITYLLKQVKGISSVGVDLEKGEVMLSMDHHVETPVLQDALKDYPKYQLTEKQHTLKTPPSLAMEEQKSWLQTYKPVLLIFAYITGITLSIQWLNERFHWMQWMNHFMAGFFLVFSFFKLLNLRGFAESYAMYDIVAKRWKMYGYIYAFMELGLGIAYLVDGSAWLVNAITFIVMGISLIGVLQSVLNKSKIKCACLGDVFNLPMSTITILEDLLMMVMSLITLLSSL